MENTFTKIFLTLSMGGESLVRPGVYKSAVIKVENNFKKGEKVTVLEPMIIQRMPLFARPTRVITLGEEFINHALTRPQPPKGKGEVHRWLKTPLGQLYKNWKKLSDRERIRFHVKALADSMGETVESFELF